RSGIHEHVSNVDGIRLGWGWAARPIPSRRLARDQCRPQAAGIGMDDRILRLMNQAAPSPPVRRRRTVSGASATGGVAGGGGTEGEFAWASSNSSIRLRMELSPVKLAGSKPASTRL